jgi:hypothetical protein
MRGPLPSPGNSLVGGKAFAQRLPGLALHLILLFRHELKLLRPSSGRLIRNQANVRILFTNEPKQVIEELVKRDPIRNAMMREFKHP